MHGSVRNLVRWGLRHLGVILAVLWGAATIAFVALKLIPGDPVSILTGGENIVDEAERAVLIQQYGLDQPLAVQYAHYLGNALIGNFGRSYQYRQPVIEVILEAAVPNALRDPRNFWHAATIARCADLTSELQELKARRLPVVVLWGSRDELVTRASFDALCESLGDPMTVTVDGSHSWLLADPDQFGEVITNVIPVAMSAGADAGSDVEELTDLRPDGHTHAA